VRAGELNLPVMNKPHIICHMLTGIDGRLHPSRFTRSPDGERKDCSSVTEAIYADFDADAWMVGRVTMVEMAKGAPHPPKSAPKPPRPFHFVKRSGTKYAIAVDPHARVHFAKSDVGGDHPVVLLGPGVSDEHLTELVADGISYAIADTEPMSLAAMMDVLHRELGIKKLLLEGGASINNAFLAAGLVDELSVIIAPGVDGTRASESIIEGDAKLQGRIETSFVSCKQLSHGLVHLKYAVRRSTES
jgi:riboflavin biosynthesis pyrimidine reductase